MDARDVIEELPITEWHGPFEPALQARARWTRWKPAACCCCRGCRSAIAPDESFLLSPTIMGSERKNISLDPATRHGQQHRPRPCRGGDSWLRMMQRFSTMRGRLLGDLLPGYAAALERARTSFRPAEIAGRDYSPRHDDRLLHVDAFPSRPMRGRRILRLFCNIAPDGAARAWRVGEPFPDFARQFLPRTGSALPGSAWLLERLGITKGRRSEYDRIMLRLHDPGKLDAAYQSDGAEGRRGIPRGHHLALLHRPGAARGARRTLRAGADVPFAGRRDGTSASVRRCACWSGWPGGL